VANSENVGHTLATSARVHAGAMTLGMDPPHHAMFVEWQVAQAREFAREQNCLVEASQIEGFWRTSEGFSFGSFHAPRLYPIFAQISNALLPHYLAIRTIDLPIKSLYRHAA
jgi:hypothetical protein